ncbi:MAG: NFACT family protein [Lachnospiraceae bacterium]|nr:NFACT family protein [Lachnospiraceae bacterium]
MAFDGMTVAAVVKELNQELSGGRVYKIAQPEPDELLLTIKNHSGQHKLMLSADASLPLLYLTQGSKPSPMTAPAFCMLLRKHLQNARIVGFEQPGLERVVRMTLEHLDEMGDLKKKDLIIEIMGKHSNIILVDEDNRIVDSIKHISGMVSSVREVLPGKDYFIPKTQEKADPLMVTENEFFIGRTGGMLNQPVYKALYGCYTGLSPAVAAAICERAEVNPEQDTASLQGTDREALWQVFSRVMGQIKKGEYSPCIYYENNVPVEFSAIDLLIFGEKRSYESVSQLLQEYYAEKNKIVRIRQRSGDLRRVVQTAIERTAKKYDLQDKQLKDTKKRETYRIYGELLNTYGYSADPGAKELEALNYYTNEMVKIPLDPTKSATENAKKYFEKYNKQKRTFEALSTLIQETKKELDHLESIGMSLELARSEDDLLQIREEMADCGYIRRKGKEKRAKGTGKPLHYLSSAGFHIYVGKNNYQNEELTFQMANGGDWWFHAKHAPGSHVIVRTEGKELPDIVYEEAASLAAYYSKVREQDKVEVDYTQRKNVKKPANGNPGMVIYHTNYSMVAVPKIGHLRQIED